MKSIGDPKLNVYQTYSVTRELYRNGHKVSQKVIARGLPVAPNNIGPKTFPNYNVVADQAIRHLPGGGKVFAGQVDDPFFVDLGATFDGVSTSASARATAVAARTTSRATTSTRSSSRSPRRR